MHGGSLTTAGSEATRRNDPATFAASSAPGEERQQRDHPILDTGGDPHFGRLLQSLRLERGVTQLVLAQRVGVSHTTIQRGESDVSERCPWRRPVAIKVYHALNAVLKVRDSDAFSYFDLAGLHEMACGVRPDTASGSKGIEGGVVAGIEGLIRRGVEAAPGVAIQHFVERGLDGLDAAMEIAAEECAKVVPDPATSIFVDRQLQSWGPKSGCTTPAAPERFRFRISAHVYMPMQREYVSVSADGQDLAECVGKFKASVADAMEKASARAEFEAAWNARHARVGGVA
jgi:transcriptional regulator with XRE-family HTH domain